MRRSLLGVPTSLLLGCVPNAWGNEGARSWATPVAMGTTIPKRVGSAAHVGSHWQLHSQRNPRNRIQPARPERQRNPQRSLGGAQIRPVGLSIDIGMEALGRARSADPVKNYRTRTRPRRPRSYLQRPRQLERRHRTPPRDARVASGSSLPPRSCWSVSRRPSPVQRFPTVPTPGTVHTRLASETMQRQSRAAERSSPKPQQLSKPSRLLRRHSLRQWSCRRFKRKWPRCAHRSRPEPRRRPMQRPNS